jgi:hypothetical protein
VTELFSTLYDDEKRRIEARTTLTDEEITYADSVYFFTQAKSRWQKVQKENPIFICPQHKGHVRVLPEGETWGRFPLVTKDTFSQAVKAAFEQLQEPYSGVYLLAEETTGPVDWLPFYSAQEEPAIQLEETQLKREFEMHAVKWYEETMYISSAVELVLHSSYQRIIGMGPAVLPLIFRDLKENERDWFWALSSITGTDPVAPEDAGNVPRMRAAWLSWGKQHEYI